jgi:hypothetical protein
MKTFGVYAMTRIAIIMLLAVSFSSANFEAMAASKETPKQSAARACETHNMDFVLVPVVEASFLWTPGRSRC